MKNRTAMLVLAGAVVFASSIGAVAGCLSLDRGGDVGAGSTPSPGGSAELGTPEATPTAAEVDVYESPRTPTTRTTTRPPEETGPRIVSLKITQRPQCPQGTTQYPVEGVPVVLEWKVTGADNVTLSVDGPGVYKTYPTEGTETLSFPCSGAPGETVTHSYLLKTVGGGAVKSKKLTASAEVHEITQV